MTVLDGRRVYCRLDREYARAAAGLSERRGVRWARLWRALAEARVLSIDVFDTAVLRTVSDPNDVFALVEQRYLASHPAVRPCSFQSERLAAQARAWRTAREVRGAEDVSLAEIYSHAQLPPGWCAEELLRHELEVELAVARPNPDVLALYREALRRGMPVVFTSDMYLPASTIADMLERNGYDGPHRLYVSCEHERTKANGSLYDVVLADLPVATTSVLHVGDNYRADVLSARRRGLRAVHLPRPRIPRQIAPCQPDDVMASSVIAGLIGIDRARPRLAGDDEVWHRMGYDIAGPIFAGFAQWLADQARTTGRERLYFFARDGWILKRVYDTFDPQVPSAYLYGSRRSLGLPALRQVDDAALDFLAGEAFADLRVADYLERIGLPTDRIDAAARAAGFPSCDALVQCEADVERLRWLFANLRDDVLGVAAEERALLVDYLGHEGVLSTARVGLVDIGWNGTLQRSLVSVLSDEPGPHDVVGFYLGTFPKARDLAEQGLQLRGYLTEFGAPVRMHGLIVSALGVLEFLHIAPHGSVVRFERDGPSVVPVFAPHDASSELLQRLAVLQQGALDFAADFGQLLETDPAVRLTPASVMQRLARVMGRPTLAEAKALGNVTYVAGFGSMITPRFLAKPPTWVGGLSSPGQVMRSYRESQWKVGYRRRLVGRLPMAAPLVERALAEVRGRGRPRRPAPQPRRRGLGSSSDAARALDDRSR